MEWYLCPRGAPFKKNKKIPGKEIRVISRSINMPAILHVCSVMGEGLLTEAERARSGDLWRTMTGST
jgi:hypothetical protein